MSKEDYYIKYKDQNGDVREANHETADIYRQHRRSIADQGGLIMETRGPVVQEGTIQVLSE